jgi:hypothetical protein
MQSPEERSGRTLRKDDACTKKSHMRYDRIMAFQVVKDKSGKPGLLIRDLIVRSKSLRVSIYGEGKTLGKESETAESVT